MKSIEISIGRGTDQQADKPTTMAHARNVEETMAKVKEKDGQEEDRHTKMGCISKARDEQRSCKPQKKIRGFLRNKHSFLYHEPPPRPSTRLAKTWMDVAE